MTYKKQTPTAEQKKNYNRGWSASVRGSETALERADARNESNEWYDGYADVAIGRRKYFLLDHPNWDETIEWEVWDRCFN